MKEQYRRERQMTLADAARDDWERWAHYQQYGFCGACNVRRYVGRATRTRRWLCIDCWDQGER